MISDQMEKFRNLWWVSGDGVSVPLRPVKVRDMTDEHIINVIIHIKANPAFYPINLRNHFILEAHSRNIGIHRYAEGAKQIPFANPVTNELTVLNEETQEFEPV
jgi:hypothetical protein